MSIPHDLDLLARWLPGRPWWRWCPGMATHPRIDDRPGGHALRRVQRVTEDDWPAVPAPGAAPWVGDPATDGAIAGLCASILPEAGWWWVAPSLPGSFAPWTLWHHSGERLYAASAGPSRLHCWVSAADRHWRGSLP